MKGNHSTRASIVLASASPRRQRLLQEAGIEFTAITSHVDERQAPTESPLAYVKRMACEKATAVAKQQRADMPVLAADTIVVLDNNTIGKPRDRDEARTTLLRLSGKTHHVLTGVCVLLDQQRHQNVTSTEVTFTTLSPPSIEAYLNRAIWNDKAGAYAIQEHGAFMVERIVGSFTNVVGLPLVETFELLARIGVLREEQ